MTDKGGKQKNWRDLWEWRAAVMLARGMAALLFVLYLLSTWPMPLQWAKMKWVRAQTIEMLPQVTEEYLAANQTQKLIEWLNMRPSFERPDIIKTLVPYSGRMEYMIFVTFSHWSIDRGDVDDATFWWQYSLYRLRYDVLRCGIGDAVEKIEEFTNVISNPKITAAINMNADKLPATLQRVLDHDAKYPAVNNPIRVCKGLLNSSTKLLPPDIWPRIRHTLRFTTEAAIKDMNKRKP